MSKAANIYVPQSERIVKSPRFWKPLFFEQSRIPIWLSRIAPIEIEAITLGVLVFSRRRLSATTKRHETIHFQQYLETLFVGFLLFYIWDYLRNWIVYRDAVYAYQMIRAEQEAYRCADDEQYLAERTRWLWLWPAAENNSISS